MQKRLRENLKNEPTTGLDFEIFQKKREDLGIDRFHIDIQ